MKPIDGNDYIAEWEVYKRVIRRCACRGAVVVEDLPTPDVIKAAVVLHQESGQHREWPGLVSGSFDVATRIRRVA